ncbi:MAG: phosphatase PAP2 family protein [Chloroflexota bacterium]
MTSHPNERAEPKVPAGTTSEGPLASVRGTPASAATMTVVVGFFALAACLFVFGTIAEGIRAHDVFTLDTTVTPFLHSLASPALDSVMQAATFIGSNLAISPLLVIAVVLLAWAHRPREALFLAIASIGSLVLNATIKLIFQRPRPIVPWVTAPTDYSFPSGHTMNSLAFYVALAIVAWAVFGRRVGVPAVIAAVALAVVIGVSRIYLGYHYFTDVFGALLAGTGWLLIVGAAFRTGPLYGLWREAKPSGTASATASNTKAAAARRRR